MKRVFLQTTLASLTVLPVYVISMILLRGILESIGDIFLRYFLSSVLMIIFYGVSLLYFANIRGRSEAQQISKDYETHPYDSFFKDFRLVFYRTRGYICCLFAISAFCFLLNMFDAFLFGEKFLGYITFVYIPIIIMDSCIPVQIVAYLVSPAYCAVTYLIAVCIYRRHCYKKRNIGG